MLTPSRKSLLGLVAASLLVRVYLAYVTPVIAMDGIGYISVAKALLAGEWGRAVTFHSHPLYPFFLVVSHLWVTDWQWAGQIVSVLFGSLSVIPFYYFSRRLFNEKVAVIASILFILHPLHARISAEVVTESTFIFFFITALLWAWKGLKNEDLLAFFAAGVGSALAFLARPEGLVILLVTGAWLAFVEPSRRVLAFNLLVLPIFLLGASYIFYLRQATGTWMLTPKKSVLVLFGLAERPEDAVRIFQLQTAKRMTDLPAGIGWLNFLWHDFIYELIQTFHPLLLILMVAGLFLVFKRTGLRREEVFVGCLAVVYLVPFLGLIWTYGYVTHRHFLPIVLISLPWAGYGLVSSVEAGSNKLDARLGHPVNTRRFLFSVVMGVAIILALKTLKPQRQDKLPMKEAGLWIKAHASDRVRVITADPRVVFYADAKGIVVKDSLKNRGPADQEAIVLRLLKKAKSERAQYIFLAGKVTHSLKTKIERIPVIASVKIWKSPRGNSYTLISIAPAQSSSLQSSLGHGRMKVRSVRASIPAKHLWRSLPAPPRHTEVL